MRGYRQWFAMGAIAILLAGGITACGGNQEAAQTNAPTAEKTGKALKLTLVSYAVTRNAYEKIIPKFVKQWQEKTGQTVTFDQSYGGSGSQTRAVIDGLGADVVALALSSDVQKIEKVGLIQPNWETEVPNDGIVTRSVVAFVTRKPDSKIATWSELADKKLQVITANPKTSGGARWNFLGLWGSVTRSGGTTAEAKTFVETIYQNVPVLPKDAREASDVFYKQGQGDVLLNYENEVILAKQKGENQPYSVPTDYNISIDAPVAVVDSIVDKKGTREVAEAFVKFLFTADAQKDFADSGFRPVNETVAKKYASQYPVIKNLFTVKDLGGWKKVQTEFFEDGAIFDQVTAKK
ncbi:MAG: sulfate ABC transporter substrate-binding protein [Microcystaceae cyanobacterium]